MSDLVETFEKEHVVIEPAADEDIIRFLLDTHDIGQRDFATRVSMAESTVSEVLARRRSLNRRQIGRIAKAFHLSPAVFVGDESF